jgi:hypothetical protein
MNPTETTAENQIEREEPMFCAVLAARPPEFPRPAELREPLDFARAVVIAIFPRNGIGLERMVDPQSLRVIIGGGNWISFECDFWPAIRGSAEALAPGFKEPIRSRILKLGTSLERKVWFRTAGKPSLHYFIEVKDGALRIRGHVDAAAPRQHPLRHLFQDYLPAHGVGSHPTAQQLWNEISRNGSA